MNFVMPLWIRLEIEKTPNSWMIGIPDMFSKMWKQNWHPKFEP